MSASFIRGKGQAVDFEKKRKDQNVQGRGIENIKSHTSGRNVDPRLGVEAGEASSNLTTRNLARDSLAQREKSTTSGPGNLVVMRKVGKGL